MGNGATKGRHLHKSGLLSKECNGSGVGTGCALATPTTAAAEASLVGDDHRPIPLKEKKFLNGSRAVELDDVLGPPESETARYRKKRAIGRGAFADAFIVERNPAFYPLPGRNVNGLEEQAANNTNLNDERRLFVAKVIHLLSMSPNDRKYAQTEIMCLACNHHFAIIQYYEHFFIGDERQTLVIITEFADQGDLHRNLYGEGSNWCLTEKEAGIQFVQLILGLDHIHRRRMIHRDVKTANIFITSRGFLKLGDFGFSQQYDSTVSNPIACTFLGTSYYLAPEMWKGQRYGKKADIWAAGVVLCELLGKRRPFEADSLPEMKEKVLSGEMWLPPVAPSDSINSNGEGSACTEKYISREMREFLERILEQDPEKRPSAVKLLKTPLMQHYLCLLEKRLEKMISLDAELEKKFQSNPDAFVESQPEYLLTADERALVLEGIAEGKSMITLETEIEKLLSNTPRLEGVVYKEAGVGHWKERYLILADGFLTMTLAKGKIAASSGERSKSVPVESLKAVAPVLLDVPQVVEGPHPITVRYGFAIATQNSQSILFATSTEEERNEWLTALVSSLDMD